MYHHISLLDRWIQENNEFVNKWQQQREGDSSNPGLNQTSLRWCSSKFTKLLIKIQGISPLPEHAQLELSVVYNSCVCATAQSQFTEAELLLRRSTERVLQMTDDEPPSLDPLVFWRTVLKSVKSKTFSSCILHLLCLQWAIWLASCQLKMIEAFQEDLRSLYETLCGGHGDGRKIEHKGKASDNILLLADPRQLVQLLQVCTLIAKGAEMLSEGQSSEALSCLQTASSLSAPRTLIAYTHHLSGCCLAHMSRPQMALQCYRKALETDARCVCALYQSMLIYRQLENTQAEIQALHLLYSTLMLPPVTELALPSAFLLSPSLLLGSQSLNSLLSVPTALSVLHNLAQKCVLHGRLSEGVEHYLDLLAILHSEEQQGCVATSQVPADVPHLPKVPELYLEAAAALLMSRRPADCMVLCEEVISTTQDVLPEKWVLEIEEQNESVTRDVNDRMAVLLWTGTASLLQGHCYTHLKDWKQAVIHYTRCINLLVRVCLKREGFQSQMTSSDAVVKKGTRLCILQKLKGLSLAGRGISFTQTDQLKEALRDLQLSLQASPEGVGAGLWLGEVLWRLGRTQEAAACWEKAWSVNKQSSAEGLPLYLQEPQSGPLLDSVELQHRIQELTPT
ncbi:Fanconi anemia group G protein isoform X2 [Betta splendens]|uniref:Fanconi anemia group G protein isoform X2 n=1 Tax=Betta splendens TaxID=158456 RepID=A0A6P7NIA1_BETSP|nr:Fanconi anemia group G protein isoform X2 [Betta splendens]